jgi:cold-inducible RNA-binding protein
MTSARNGRKSFFLAGPQAQITQLDNPPIGGFLTCSALDLLIDFSRTVWTTNQRDGLACDSASARSEFDLFRLVGHHSWSLSLRSRKLVFWAVFSVREFVQMGKKLYVGNLSFKMTDESLEALFAEFGEVRSAQVVLDRDTGRSRGFGFVEMADDQAAEEAIQQLNQKTIEGRPLTVNEARPREDRGGRGGGGNYARRY